MTLPSPGENIVTLTWLEAMQAAQVGVARHLRARRDGLQNRDGSPYKPSDWDVNIEGAGAEMAFAKWIGVFPGFVQELDGGVDVAGCQVKSSTFDGAHLIIPQGQRTDTPCVLVTGRLPEYTVRGWYWPADAEEKWRRKTSHGVGFWIPAEALYPLADLKAWIRSQAAA